MKAPFISLCFLILFLLQSSCSEKRFDEEAARIVKTMPLQKKIGQLLMVAVPGTTLDDKSRTIIDRFAPGGIIYFGYNITSRDQLTALTASFQSYSMEKTGYPLFVSIDQEGGRVIRVTEGVTQFPGNMAAGVAGDDRLVHDWGRVLGIELRVLGINMNLAPDIDVNNNPDNPVINIRSFGSDAATVSRLGAAYIRGLQASRCIAVAKHFPGHGDTDTDSHVALPVIRYSLDDLRKNELVPFARAVEAGVDGVMSAHISFPAILEPGETATVSKKFLTDILRTEMKFRGLVLTDDMEMHAIARRMKTGDAAVKAVGAGADIVLMSSYGGSIPEVVKALEKAVTDGALPLEQIDRSVERIIEAKLRYGIMKYDPKTGAVVPGVYVPGEKDQKFLARAESINRSLSQKGILYRGDPKHLANIYAKKIIVTEDPRMASAVTGIENLAVTGPAGAERAILDARGEAILFYHEWRFSSPSLVNVYLMSELAKKQRIPFILISTGNPFPVAKLPEAVNVLYAFSSTEASLGALALVLDRKHEPTMNAPLRLIR